MHKKIKIKIGTKKNNLSINTITDFQEDNEINNNKIINNKKYRKSETFKINLKENALTDNKIIETETNSSEYSDVPSYISYSKVKKQKEEQSQKIKELKEKNEINDEVIEKFFFTRTEIKIEDKKSDKKLINKDNKKDNKKIKNINNKRREKEKIIKSIEQQKYFMENNKKKYIFSENNNVNINKYGQQKFEETNDNNIDKSHDNNLNKMNEYKFITEKDYEWTNNYNNKNNIRIKLNKNEKEKENESNIKMNKSNYKKGKSISDKKNYNKYEDESYIKNKKYLINKKKKMYKSQKNIQQFEEDKDSFENKNIEISDKKNKNRKMSKKSFNDLIFSINDELNIPGRNNKIPLRNLGNSLPLFNSRRKNYILNSFDDDEDDFELYKNDSFFEEYNPHIENKGINIIEKNKKYEKLKSEIIENNYRTISYFNLKDDSRLVLLKPILKYTLYNDHEKSNLSNIINRLFQAKNKITFSLKLNSNRSRNSLKSNSSSVYPSEDNSGKNNNRIDIPTKRKKKLKDDNAYVKRRVYKNITEKYSQQFFVKKYYKDDNDLLNSRRNRIYKIHSKKTKREVRFKEFMIEELNKINDGNLSDDFENTKKDNEKIRQYIKKKRDEKRRKMEEWDRKFKLFKSHVEKLKRMDDLEFKHDSIRFLYKINDNN